MPSLPTWAQKGTLLDPTGPYALETIAWFGQNHEHTPATHARVLVVDEQIIGLTILTENGKALGCHNLWLRDQGTRWNDEEWTPRIPPKGLNVWDRLSSQDDL